MEISDAIITVLHAVTLINVGVSFSFVANTFCRLMK